MEEKDQLVDIPEYARYGKNNSIYALKKDTPYYRDEENIRGHVVIGKLSEEPGKMIPKITYFWYCTEESVKQKIEEKLQREREEAERERLLRKAEEERERNLGWQFIPLEKVWDDMTVYPIHGFLAEQFFSETGISDILEDVLGPERAFWVKLYTAQMATKGTNTFEYGFLNRCPLRRHTVFRAERGFSFQFWSGISQEDQDAVLQRMTAAHKKHPVYAMASGIVTTLVHTKVSDQYSDNWFVQRIRTGTRYRFDFVLYCDRDTGRPLTIERLRYDFEQHFGDGMCPEIHTIWNSEVPSFQSAPIAFYLNPYFFQLKGAAKKLPMTACIFPSEYPNQKELKKYLKELESLNPEKDRRILRWEGELDGTAGTWMLLELTKRRKCEVENAPELLRDKKRRLSLMSYYPASEDCDSIYFDIDKDGDDTDFFDNALFTVKAVKGATEKIRLNAGRFLYFTTEEPLTDEQLVRRQWLDEDLYWQLRSYVDHGETADNTEYFDEAMSGRDLPLLLSCLYRVWLYEHLEDQITSDWDIREFAEEMERWGCDVSRDGEVSGDKVSVRLRKLLKCFHATPIMLKDYVEECVKSPNYFSDEYLQEW